MAYGEETLNIFISDIISTFQLNLPALIFGGEEAPAICYSDQLVHCLSSDEYAEDIANRYEEEMKFAGKGTNGTDGKDYKTDITNGSVICKTVGGADPGQSCIFPFTFRRGSYTECTTDGNPPDDPNPWCSTLTDENGFHVGGQGKWGYCSPQCPNGKNS